MQSDVSVLEKQSVYTFILGSQQLFFDKIHLKRSQTGNNLPKFAVQRRKSCCFDGKWWFNKYVGLHWARHKAEKCSLTTCDCI